MDLDQANGLRKQSEALRLEGRVDEALGAAQAAVSGYRSNFEELLGLAEGLRTQALALDALDRGPEAEPLWREARDLFIGMGAQPEVEDCDARLAS